MFLMATLLLSLHWVLVVLALGLLNSRAATLCSGVAAAGLLFASSAVLMLPAQASLFNGMLVITPLVSLFKVICIALAFFTVSRCRLGGQLLQPFGQAFELLVTFHLPSSAPRPLS